MIVKGGRRGGAQQLATHLLRRDTNEAVTIRELNSYPSQNMGDNDLKAALRLMAAEGQAKGKKRTFYHSIIAPQEGEILDSKQLKYAVDTLARNLGMDGHSRAVVEHCKDGRQHFHVVFNVLHPDTGKQARLKWTRKVEWNTSRQLEKELGLKAVVTKGKASKQWEHQRGKRSGISPQTVRGEVTAIYHASRTGAEFVRNLAKAGYVLARGRDNKLVLVDKAGDVHGLIRRIEGVKAKDLRQKFPELQNMYLPSLESILRQRRPQKEIRSSDVVPQHVRTEGFGSTSDKPNKDVGSEPKAETRVSQKPVKIDLGQKSSPSTIAQKSAEQLGASDIRAHVDGISGSEVPAVKIAQATASTVNHAAEGKPHLHLSKKGWPEAAVIDWEAWGHRETRRFFTKWPELASPHHHSP